MTTVEKAIEAGYEAQISALYKALSQGVLAANGDESEITAAEARFKKGLALPQTLKLANLQQQNKYHNWAF